MIIREVLMIADTAWFKSTPNDIYPMAMTNFLRCQVLLMHIPNGTESIMLLDCGHKTYGRSLMVFSEQ